MSILAKTIIIYLKGEIGMFDFKKLVKNFVGGAMIVGGIASILSAINSKDETIEIDILDEEQETDVEQEEVPFEPDDILDMPLTPPEEETDEK